MAEWQRRLTRDRHEGQIRKWKGRQRRQREWINFADMADWCSRMPGDVARDRTRQAQGFLDLLDAVLAGEFDQAGRCRVGYLPGATTIAEPLRLHLQVDYLRDCRDAGAASAVLADCWAPRVLCLRWFKARGIKPPPGLHDREAKPAASPTTNEQTAYKTGAPGRPTSMQLIEAEMRRRAAAGEMITATCKAEAEWLVGWLELHHPGAPRLKSKTISNNRSGLWQSLKASMIPK
jgi:hypothetical protein